MIKSKEVSSKNVVYVSFAQRHKKHAFVLGFFLLFIKLQSVSSTCKIIISARKYRNSVMWRLRAIAAFTAVSY